MSNEYTKPLPVIDVWNKPFWEGTKEHKLMVQKCNECGLLRFPPGPTCPSCLSTQNKWVQLNGHGIVRSWIVFNYLYYKGFADELPYNVATVELDEGIKLITNLVGVENDQISTGMAVKVVYEDVTDEITLPKFTPVLVK